MDFEVDTDQLKLAENRLYKESDAFHTELNVWVDQIERLKDIWTGEDADIFYRKIEEYITKLRMVSETEKNLGKLLRTSYSSYEDQDSEFMLELKKDNEQYDDEEFMAQAAAAGYVTSSRPVDAYVESKSSVFKDVADFADVHEFSGKGHEISYYTDSNVEGKENAYTSVASSIGSIEQRPEIIQVDPQQHMYEQIHGTGQKPEIIEVDPQQHLHMYGKVEGTMDKPEFTSTGEYHVHGKVEGTMAKPEFTKVDPHQSPTKIDTTTQRPPLSHGPQQSPPKMESTTHRPPMGGGPGLSGQEAFGIVQGQDGGPSWHEIQGFDQFGTPVVSNGDSFAPKMNNDFSSFGSFDKF